MLKEVSKIILTSPTYPCHLKLIQIQPKTGVFKGPGGHFVAHRGSRWEEPLANLPESTGIILCESRLFQGLKSDSPFSCHS